MKAIFTLALCLSLASVACAQDSSRVQHPREHRMPDLQLTSDQKAQFKTINKDFFTASHDLRSDSTLSKADRKTKFEALNADHQNKIKAVLTEDQYAKWQQAETGRKSHMGKGDMKGMQPGHRPDFAQMQQKQKTDLGLSDDQSKQLSAANKDFFKSMGELRHNNSSDSATRRTQFVALKTQYDAKIKGILSADQFAKWQARQKDMREHMGPGGRPDFAHMNDKVKQDLGLNDEQSQQLSAATQDFFKSARSLHDNNSGDTAARRTQFQALKAQYDTKVQAILTPDQFAKWQQRHSQMHRGGHGRPMQPAGSDNKQ